MLMSAKVEVVRKSVFRKEVSVQVRGGSFMKLKLKYLLSTLWFVLFIWGMCYLKHTLDPHQWYFPAVIITAFIVFVGGIAYLLGNGD